MNDRFKFRVWDKINGIWVKNFSIDEQGYVEGFYNPPQAMNRRLVLMQCTGLKDNNGKFIYEGDIVRFYSPYGHATFEIKWSEEFATFGYEDNETDFSEFGRLYDDARYVEVIGNIYENKELLEEE